MDRRQQCRVAELRWSRSQTSAEIIIHFCGKLLKSHNNSGKEVMLQKAENTQEAFTHLHHVSKEGFIHFNNNVSCIVRTTPAVLLCTRPSFALPSQFSLETGENNQCSQLCERGSACHTTLQSHLGISSRCSSWTMNAEDPQNQNSLPVVLAFSLPTARCWSIVPVHYWCQDADQKGYRHTDTLPNTLQNSSGLSHYNILYFKTQAISVTLKSQL